MTENLSRLAGSTLNIVQMSIWKSNYELRYNDEILGTITRRSIFVPGVILKLFKKEWEIYHPGFWSLDTAVKEKGKENPFATFKRKFFSREGIVYLPKGKRLIIKLGVFRGKYGIYDQSGKCLVIFKDKITFKSNTEVTIEEPPELLDEYPWVIILAWHLARQKKRSGAGG